MSSARRSRSCSVRSPSFSPKHPLELPADASALALVAHRNGLRLLKLVNTVLDFSRLEAGRVQASFEPTDLSRLTAELASNFQSVCDRAGLTLEIDCEPIGEPVYVDRDMWEKIVLNLLSNAFKFTLEGGIAVRLTAREGRAELAVRDTGVGIPASELPRIFERFHRVEGQASRSHEGSGIGLALVRELVRLHAGSVTVESEPGRLSEFIVSVPLGTDHLPADRIGGPVTLSPTAVHAPAFIGEASRWLPPEVDNAQRRAASQRQTNRHHAIAGRGRRGRPHLARRRQCRHARLPRPPAGPRAGGRWKRSPTAKPRSLPP